MAIKRNTDVMCDIWADQMEDIFARDDIDIEKKIKLANTCSQNVLGYAKVNLMHKQMYMRSPDVAKNKSVVLTIGGQNTKEIKKKA